VLSISFKRWPGDEAQAWNPAAARLRRIGGMSTPAAPSLHLRVSDESAPKNGDDARHMDVTSYENNSIHLRNAEASS
jgi:hypothetical protein